MREVSVLEKPKPGATTPARDAVKYTMRGTQLLSSGITTIPLATSANLWVFSKVYSGGGENNLHAHAYEEHTFFVLEGRAEFEFADGRKEICERYDGILIPAGALYKFQALGQGNLVMLRVGSQRDGLKQDIRLTLDEHGKPILNNYGEDKGAAPAAPVIALEGQFFPKE